MAELIPIAINLSMALIVFAIEKAVFVVVLFHLILGAIFSLPYVSWRKRVHAAGPVAAG